MAAGERIIGPSCLKSPARHRVASRRERVKGIKASASMPRMENALLVETRNQWFDQSFWLCKYCWLLNIVEGHVFFGRQLICCPWFHPDMELLCSAEKLMFTLSDAVGVCALFVGHHIHNAVGFFDLACKVAHANSAVGCQFPASEKQTNKPKTSYAKDWNLERTMEKKTMTPENPSKRAKDSRHQPHPKRGWVKHYIFVTGSNKDAFECCSVQKIGLSSNSS